MGRQRYLDLGRGAGSDERNLTEEHYRRLYERDGVGSLFRETLIPPLDDFVGWLHLRITLG